jgi:hypothetical protein
MQNITEAWIIRRFMDAEIKATALGLNLLVHAETFSLVNDDEDDRVKIFTLHNTIEEVLACLEGYKYGKNFLDKANVS